MPESSELFGGGSRSPPASRVRAQLVAGVPGLDARLAEVVQAVEGCRAIVLFGSRARQTHRDDSDWDLAAVVDGVGGGDGYGHPEYRRLVDDFAVDFIWIGVEDFARYVDCPYSLEAQIVRQARVVTGSWDRPPSRDHGLRVSWQWLGTRLGSLDNHLLDTAWLFDESAGDRPSDPLVLSRRIDRALADLAVLAVVGEGLVPWDRASVPCLAGQLEREGARRRSHRTRLETVSADLRSAVDPALGHEARLGLTLATIDHWTSTLSARGQAGHPARVPLRTS